MTPELGIIDGRFGRPWTWDARTQVMQRLAPAGYRFFHYGPKADAHLRRDWRTPHDSRETAALAAFAGACRDAGVRFGIAFTPIGAPEAFDADMRAALAARLAAFDAIGIDDLAILFDDLRGDVPGLAARQADVVAFCAATTRATHLWFCPTYYSHDPVLDRVFGQRAPDYLAELGRRLDPAVRIYWTGEEVCSREISPGHLQSVAAILGRRVSLWDNYPVNDGERMSRHLHLRAFTGRPAANAGLIEAHAINPAVQPTLTCIPALTLARSYAEGERYRYGAAFADAAREVLGEELATMVTADLLSFQDGGWDRLGDRRAMLTARYAAIDHPAAREIANWLDGADLMTAHEVATQ